MNPPEILDIETRVRRVADPERLERIVALSGREIPEEVVGEAVAGVLPVEGERAAARGRGMSRRRAPVVPLVAETDRVFSSDQIHAGLGVNVLASEESGRVVWQTESSIAGEAHRWQPDLLGAPISLESLDSRPLGQIVLPRRRCVLVGVRADEARSDVEKGLR